MIIIPEGRNAMVIVQLMMNPLANAKFEENITYHIDASERSLRDEFLNLKDILIKRLQDENTRLSLEVIRRQSHSFRGELK